jgi:4,5-DOPA dioxygenase extradiol
VVFFYAILIDKKLKTYKDKINMIPALFIGHGSPMNALEDNHFIQNWKTIANSFPKPNSILVISAHWETDGTIISGSSNPKTIHDFGGFPEQLSSFQYPVLGNPILAEKLAAKLGIGIDPNRGLDHGAWSVLCQMYPEADIPTSQISLDHAKTPQQHFEFAQKLSYLRGEGVLIIGTGNIVHNLAIINWQEGKPYPWATEFNGKIVEYIQKRDFESIMNYTKFGSISRNSVPTPEHFWPLLYVLGISRQDEKITIFNDEIIMGSISMTSCFTN